MSDVRLEADDHEAKYVPKGGPIEVGMIKFLLLNDCKADENGGPGHGLDVPGMLKYRNEYRARLQMLPFDQSRKRKVVIRKHAADQDLVRVYVQGAPEEVIKLCNFSLDDRDGRVALTADDKGALLGTVGEMAASREIAGGLKVFSYAFKDMEAAELAKQLDMLKRM